MWWNKKKKEEYKSRSYHQKPRYQSADIPVWSNPPNNRRTIHKVNLGLFKTTIIKDRPLAPQGRDKELEALRKRVARVEERQRQVVEWARGR